MGRCAYLERLAVDDETTIELILQKVKFVLGLFGSLDYMSIMVSRVHYITATRATQKGTHAWRPGEYTDYEQPAW